MNRRSQTTGILSGLPVEMLYENGFVEEIARWGDTGNHEKSYLVRGRPPAFPQRDSRLRCLFLVTRPPRLPIHRGQISSVFVWIEQCGRLGTVSYCCRSEWLVNGKCNQGMKWRSISARRENSKPVRTGRLAVRDPSFHLAASISGDQQTAAIWAGANGGELFTTEIAAGGSASMGGKLA